MHRNIAKVAIVAAALIVPIAAGASQLSGWVDSVNARVDRVMPAADATGEIRVRFHRGTDGRAAGVTVIGGNSQLADCAERTLARLGVLPPLPSGYDAATPITLNLMVGKNERYELANDSNWKRAVRKAHAQASAQNAQFAARHEGPDQLALANPR